jgi:hypothetical protein
MPEGNDRIWTVARKPLPLARTTVTSRREACSEPGWERSCADASAVIMTANPNVMPSLRMLLAPRRQEQAQVRA